jgi:hypothetical protein
MLLLMLLLLLLHTSLLPQLFAVDSCWWRSKIAQCIVID